MNASTYRGRIAPTPTGFLHRGHAATFRTAFERAGEERGILVLRMEDLDPARCKEYFSAAAMEDLKKLGISWQEGPDIGGPYGPYRQSARRSFYLEAWRRLKDGGFIYPSAHSRRDVQNATRAPHAEDDAEPLFPKQWRAQACAADSWEAPAGINWRFRVPDGRRIVFEDALQGEQCFVAGEDFGDFVVWRRDDIPAYELAVVVDDAAMQITEVVRGADLLKSTARQLLLYEALGWKAPRWCHCPLVLDAQGKRLSKRAGAARLTGN